MASRVKETLCLEPEGECQLAIAAFGNRRSASQPCEVVRVGVKVNTGPDLELNLFTVPYICEPLSVQPISLCTERYKHLSHLELADTSDGKAPMDIDVLIGSDNYWKLITGEIRHGDSGSVAVHTRFGWVLSGPTVTTSQITSVTSLVATHTLRVDAEPDTSRDLDSCLRSFWDLESLGIHVCDSEGSRTEDTCMKYPCHGRNTIHLYQQIMIWLPRGFKVYSADFVKIQILF